MPSEKRCRAAMIFQKNCRHHHEGSGSAAVNISESYEFFEKKTIDVHVV